MDPPNRSVRKIPRPVVPGMSRGLRGGGWLLLFFAFGCGEPELAPAPPERIVILPGMPRAESAPGWVDVGERDGGEIRPSRPRICETFGSPQESGAIDLLLVVDLGRSMASRRDLVLESLGAGLNAIFVARRPSFRVGILSAAAPAAGEPLGRLVPIPGGPTAFVTCTPEDLVEPCSHGTWENARNAILATVASLPSTPASLGLLSLAQALEGSEKGAPAFLRDGADLHVVVVSDADDLSCSSRVAASVACHSFEGCACAQDSEHGSVDEFVRLLRGLKGYGYENRVRFSAWVATSSEPLTMGEGRGLYVGCAVNPAAGSCETPWEEGAPCALSAPRYAQVAQALGGRVYDLCSEPEGLAKIGAFVAGTAAEFSLRRNPLPSTVETVLLSFPDKSCNHLEPCLEEGFDCIRGRCGQVVSVGGADGWQYVSCSSGIPGNFVRFGSPDRIRNRKIEICYDVDVGADPLPCP